MSQGRIFAVTFGFNAIKATAVVIVLLTVISYIGWRSQDVPADVVPCTGEIEPSQALKFDWWAEKVGDLIYQMKTYRSDHAVPDVKRAVEGTARFAGTLLATVYNAANGRDLPPEAQKYETDFQKQQQRHTDGCQPCPGAPAGPTDEAEGIPSPNGYSDPVPGAVIGATFGAVGSWSRYHTGLDYRAGMGVNVKAVTAGKVVYRGNKGDWAGNHVAVRHADGKTTMYSHLSAMSVDDGQTVQAGTVLGKVGSTGRSFGPHLHLELYPAGVNPGDVYKAVDPRPWLKTLKARPSVVSTGGTGEAAVRAAVRQYFPADQVDMAMAVAKAESTYRANAVNNYRGMRMLGIFQINESAWPQLVSTGDWQDVTTNTKWAHSIWQQQGWKPWSTWRSAAASIGGLPQSVSEKQGEGEEQGGEARGERIAPQPEAPPVAPEACSLPQSAPVPQSFTAGGIRTVTDPTSKITYKVPIPEGKAGVAVNFALDQLGDPYVFGSQGPDSWDCSGLVSKAWAAAGVEVYPQTGAIARQEPPASGSPRGGDLLWSASPDHVQMFLTTLPSGKALIVESPRPGKKVQVLAQWMDVDKTFRPDAQAV